MHRSTMLRGIIAAGLLGLTAPAMAASPPRAAGSDGPRRYHYEWVTTYITRQVPYVQSRWLYDWKDEPFRVSLVGYKTVRVPVKRRVLVRD